ncbi:TetR family transcriptional regulator [Nocardioides insulae]|uniref:TetR family transcriptional regulator n=1 Tax=Nocardioides insulae TaxID=394734 RepID=UPI00056534E2|nr:TetR family transcriptional regulator [Nocardioides insulae]
MENIRYSSEAFKSQPKTPTSVSRLDLICSAAVTVFSQKGYDAASVADIAAASGILKGSLYHYLTAKEDLLFYLISKINEEVIDIANAAEARHNDPLLQLRDFARTYTTYNAANRVAVAVYYTSWRQLSEPRYRIARAQRALMTSYLIDLLTTAQQSDRISAHLRPDLAAYFFYGASNSVYTWFPNAHEDSVDLVAQEFSDQWIAMLTAKGQPGLHPR